jgi:hypothetical protein
MRGGEEGYSLGEAREEGINFGANVVKFNGGRNIRTLNSNDI